MTSQLVAYAVLVGLLLVVAGHAMEWLAGARRQPRRWVWAATLAASVAIGIGVPLSRQAPVAPSVVVSAPVVTAPIAVYPPVEATQSVVGSGFSRTAPSVVASGFSRTTIEPIVQRVWPLATAGLLLLYAAGHLTLALRRRRWAESDVNGVPVLVSRDVGPAVIGILKPRIVLPAWTLDGDTCSIDLILRHEGEHLRARDPLLIQLGRIAVLVMPWNPAAWWMVSRLKLAIELDCDARVLRDVADSSTYGEVLLAVGSHRSPRHAFLGPAMLERSSSLARRIAAISPTRLRFVGLRAAAACGLALAILAAIVLLPAPALRAAAVIPSVPPAPPRHDVALAMGQVDVQVQPQSVPQNLTAPTGSDAVGSVYTPEPMRRKIQEVLDQAAIDAAKTWVFKPCMKDGPLACVLGAAPQTLNPPSEEVYQPGNGVSWPVLIRQVGPQYTSAAMNAKIQGTVYLTAVVETDGTLGHIRVSKSLDAVHGLDQAAIDAASKWLFTPCKKDGQPVRCAIQLELDFRLDEARVTGYLWTEKDAPVPNGTVQIRNTSTGQVVKSARTNVRGEFEFPGIRSGPYVIEYVDSQDSSRIIAVGTPFSVRRGETVATFVRTGKGGSAPQTESTVNGHLKQVNNQPISNVPVQIRNTESGQVEMFTRTNSVGEFSFTGVKSRSYVVEQDEFAKGTFSESEVTGLKVIRTVEPQYTSEAMRQKIQGDVKLQIVVGVRGTIERARVAESLDKVYGLDNSALDAAKKWLFEPGRVNGRPVPTLTTITLTFRLH